MRGTLHRATLRQSGTYQRRKDPRYKHPRADRSLLGAFDRRKVRGGGVPLSAAELSNRAKTPAHSGKDTEVAYLRP